MSTTNHVPRTSLGHTGIDTPVLALGSWHTWDRMDFRDAVSLVKEAVDRGVNLFDVGVYSMPQQPGFTDVIFSAMVRAAGLDRTDYLVSTKLWLEDFDPDRGFRDQLTSAFLRSGLEHTDLVVLGDVRDADTDLAAIVQTMDALVREGLVRTWGVNNWSATNVALIRERARSGHAHLPSFAQLKYSVARRSIPDGAPFAALFADGLALETSDVMEGGLLAGRPLDARQVGRDPGDIRARIVAAAPAVARLAQDLGGTPAQLLIAFAMSHPAAFTTLFGTSRPAQFRENLGAVDLLHRVGADTIREAVAPLWIDRGIVSPEGP